MFIQCLALTRQGVEARAHRIHSLNVSDDRVEITINSYVNETGTMPVWQDAYPMPFDDFCLGTYPQNVHEWLISPSGPFLGGSVVLEVSKFEDLKVKTLARINELRKAVAEGGCETPFGVVDTTPTSQSNIQAAFSMATLAKASGQPYSVVWRRLDNTEVTLDADGVIAMGAAVLAHIDRAYRHSWTLKAQVEAATTLEELESMILAGWATHWEDPNAEPETPVEGENEGV
ncbi:DUF4376 domain-containing protein [Brevundimonas sp. NPDC058933]|uniref:DUF4376 domain-containing protein n=1 Tax=Brevundimonas sp. NPDC058933 TaxID=3346673 RepID=UPI003BEF033C